METWKGTVRRAREIEGLLEARLPELKNPKDVEAALVELRSCVDAMASIVQQAPTTANAAVLQRYTEALSDFEAEFKRSSARAREQRDRENLFRGADTSDIEGGGRDDPNADLDPLAARDPLGLHPLALGYGQRPPFRQ
ncbi:hypothetical protein CTAYLR_002516 [Chrysophaeum taylorii]|uniref:Uncharacterized protein n=1 Tax=Chrysophaeum taylorii TaxID=2483200 RepID=A0AAD7UGI5_9STRA|nr:hypothetical protein CTAYLR_002516 [Chrysophaeum taylorii]